MRTLVALFFLLIHTALAHASDSAHQVTYWIAETDTSGWTIQNVNAALPVYLSTGPEQAAGIENIALNDVRLRAGRLVRPADPRRTRIINYDNSTAAASLLSTLPAYGTLYRTLALLVADYAANDSTWGLADTVTVLRTVQDSAGVNVTTAIAGFAR